MKILENVKKRLFLFAVHVKKMKNVVVRKTSAPLLEEANFVPCHAQKIMIVLLGIIAWHIQLKASNVYQ
jgi:hypothetical protein